MWKALDPDPEYAVPGESLGVVELVMCLEDLFGFQIPDAVAEKIRTVGQIKEYVSDQVQRMPSDSCLSQRSFYDLRRTICETLDALRHPVDFERTRPHTRSEVLRDVERLIMDCCGVYDFTDAAVITD